MSEIRAQPPAEQPSKKPPRCYWKATESFFDFKASHWVEIFLTLALIGVGLSQLFVYWRQTGIMNTQADIAKKQTEIALQSSRAIVYAKDVRVEKKDGPTPGQPYWWFSPVLENGGNTSTKNMRISAQSAFDPSRPEIEVKLPLGAVFGPKQQIIISHLPEVGPFDPEIYLGQAEDLERQGKPSHIIRTILGPHVSQSISGFGVPIEEAKRRMQAGARWYLLGAIRYNDRFADTSTRISKYCFAIGFEMISSGDFNSIMSPCPHWNCADEECQSDKSAYDIETAGWQAPALFIISPPTPDSNASPK